MSDRTQFWLGSLMLAVAVGLLLGGLVLPEAAIAQEGEGRSGRYAFVTGVSGSTPNSETIYVLDDLNQMLFIFEYSSRAKDIRFRQFQDLQEAATAGLKRRASRERD